MENMPENITGASTETVGVNQQARQPRISADIMEAVNFMNSMVSIRAPMVQPERLAYERHLQLLLTRIESMEDELKALRK